MVEDRNGVTTQREVEDPLKTCREILQIIADIRDILAEVRSKAEIRAEEILKEEKGCK